MAGIAEARGGPGIHIRDYWPNRVIAQTHMLKG